MTAKKKLLLRISIYLIVFVGCMTAIYRWSGGFHHMRAKGHQPMPETRQALPSPEEIAKLPKDGGPEFNRLIFEKSPYLLQHARNPVNWFPWGDEAFQLAKEQDKAVFLSVGYSTCHWCHVMEHESFEDEEVAELMNNYFVCIKVDREERPDIDNVYMTVTQVMTNSGGWPMTIVMTPDKKPFFAGTYFPKEIRYGRAGMMQIVPRLGEAWKNQRETVLESSEKIVAALTQHSGGSPGEAMGESVLQEAFRQQKYRYDRTHGGFGQKPKFPTPHNLSYLLRYWKRTGNQEALDMVEYTLIRMRLGGMWDHVGFGTHRYSTDQKWLLPHFEKMLYDQAMLSIANVEAFQATGKKKFAQTAEEIFIYVLRDMTSPEGGFYSAEDADSEGVEGKFYVFKPEEIIEILGEEEGQFFNAIFNIVEGGNFVEEASGHNPGDNIPHLRNELKNLTSDFKMSEEQLRERVETARAKVFKVREKRIHPYKDDKILTDWNGLMIAALSKGGRALNEPKYTQAAKKAADFVLKELTDDEGRLLKRYRLGSGGLPAHLEDYAYLTWGLLELYEACFDVRYLKEAIRLTDFMLAHFWDGLEGGLFLTSDEGEELIVRSKDIYDGARPSGNSVATLNLLRLGRITTNPEYEKKAEGIIRAFSGSVASSPLGHSQLMIAVDFAVGPAFEVIVAGDPSSADTKEMLQAIRKVFLPNKVVVLRPDQGGEITKLAPYTEEQESKNGAATAYVCQNFACKLPTTDIKEVLKSLGVK
ncbi:MAG: thioredoxin domain-containing protein [Planctomycetota bacterium]|nr:thioredoxin domain-containing protein [Planctomycetota bacterium]MDA1142834.1 thioredoxin domain-containing protein [Planctomycetota bacterium]